MRILQIRPTPPLRLRYAAASLRKATPQPAFDVERREKGKGPQMHEVCGLSKDKTSESQKVLRHLGWGEACWARKMRILQICPTPPIASASSAASLRKATPRPAFDAERGGGRQKA